MMKLHKNSIRACLYWQLLSTDFENLSASLYKMKDRSTPFNMKSWDAVQTFSMNELELVVMVSMIAWYKVLFYS